MEENKSINERADRILLSRAYHGKSRVARILDGVVAVLSSLVIFYVLIFLLTRSNLYSVILSILLTGFIGAAIRLFDRARQRRNLARQRQTLARELCAELLCTASHEEFLRWAAPQLQKNGAVLSQDAAAVTIAGQTMPAVFFGFPSTKNCKSAICFFFRKKADFFSSRQIARANLPLSLKNSAFGM